MSSTLTFTKRPPRSSQIHGGPIHRFSREPDRGTCMEIAKAGTVTVVRFPRRTHLDEANVQDIGNQLFGLSAREGRGALYVDLANVTFLTASGLGVLVALHRQLRAAGRRIVVFNVSPFLYEVLII